MSFSQHVLIGTNGPVLFNPSNETMETPSELSGLCDVDNLPIKKSRPSATKTTPVSRNRNLHGKHRAAEKRQRHNGRGREFFNCTFSKLWGLQFFGRFAPVKRAYRTINVTTTSFVFNTKKVMCNNENAGVRRFATVAQLVNG